jgi:hypothetical protein
MPCSVSFVNGSSLLVMLDDLCQHNGRILYWLFMLTVGPIDFSGQYGIKPLMQVSPNPSLRKRPHLCRCVHRSLVFTAIVLECSTVVLCLQM